MEGTVHDAVGGYDALLALAHAWHERCLADPVVSHAFSHGFHPQHSQRLAAYWAEALGGPDDYTRSISDQTTVLALHSGNGEHREMDERALGCFVLALDDTGLSADPIVRDTLLRYFDWAIQEMAAYPETADEVPPGLPLPRWSWSGPEATI